MLYQSLSKVEPHSASVGVSFAFLQMTKPKPLWKLTDVSPKLAANPDFGKLESRQTLYRRRVGPYIVSKPITIETYWNTDGYTSIIAEFDTLYGYGDSLQASVDDALFHLEQDRDFYGQIQDGTATALDLRSHLQSYLIPFLK